MLKADHVNIAHARPQPAAVGRDRGQAAADPELRRAGDGRYGRRPGINLVGLCCTGNELLMRRGVPMAGNHLMQELVMMTGALEAMVVDYQCIMPSVVDVAKCFHTQVISTSDKAKFPGATHIVVRSRRTGLEIGTADRPHGRRGLSRTATPTACASRSSPSG